MRVSGRIALGVGTLTLAAATHAQTCVAGRYAASAGALANEYGWDLDFDYGEAFTARSLVVAPGERAYDPVTGSDWGDDGGCYVYDVSPGVSLEQRLQWSTDLASPALGRGGGALDGDFVVLGDGSFGVAGSDLYAFTNVLFSGFAAEGRVVVPKPAGVAVEGLDFDVEAGRLVVLTRQDLGPTQATWMHTYVRSPGAWTLAESLDLGAAGVGAGARSLALEGDRAYVAFESGTLAKYVWNGTGWSASGSASAAQGGTPFGSTLAVQAGRIVGVGANGGSLVLYSFADTGAAPVAEQLAPLPPTAVLPSDVAIEGNRVAVGSPSANNGRGQVERLMRAGATWQFQETLAPAVAGSGESFGRAVSLAFNTLSVGAPHAPAAGFTERGFVEVVDLTGTGCASLLVYPSSVSLSAPGTPVELALVGPASVAGFGYMVLFALSPASPGIPLDGVFVPLANDALLFGSIQYANVAPLSNTVGLLDAAAGSGAPALLAQQLSPNLAGTQVWTAWFAFNLATPPFGAFFGSEARRLTFLP